MLSIFKRVKYNKYGWKPDIPDQRDFVFKTPRAFVALPPKIDLRSYCSPVENQSTLGSCTANAIAGALEYAQIKNGLSSYEEISRLFIYYNERMMEGTIQSDAGATLRSGIKSLVKYGACSESLWPYSISKFATKPNCCSYRDATNHKVLEYQRISSLEDMKFCLASDLPFVFGISIYVSFESVEVRQTGIVPMPGIQEKCLGGHAVCAVGYDDEKEWLIVRNSWGNQWGDKGYFYLPYEYAEKLGGDFWAIIKTTGYLSKN
ncbi:MAG TPA: C1 family peptidase [Methanofastidiosum sp.]|nr:C1 family peptidase [Methanofastidiosum sp.]